MRFGYQKGYWRFRFKGKSFSIGVSEILCVLAGIGLFAMMEFSSKEDPLKAGYVYRSGYGQGEEEIRLIAQGAGEDARDLELAFTVEERRYREEEAPGKIEELAKQLPSRIAKGNPSLDQVRTNLDLITSDRETGFRIRWASSESGLVSPGGEVYGEGADPENGQKVFLTAEIFDGYGNFGEAEIPVTVFPPALSEEEQQKAGLLEEIRRMEGQDRTKEGFYLPEEYKGKPVTYRSPEESGHIWLLFMGPVMALLLRARKISNEKQQRKEREKKLLLDYSQVVSKLQIFLGAGMTVRTAWERIVLDYQDIREKGEEERPAYEEMLQTYYQLKSGAAEGKAYGEFGRRCMLQPYLKLAGLLEQNRKTGTKNLRYLLQTEMADAFEQRKNLARRQGEEAATKLLIPLFLMLGVVMVIVVVPAFLTFYG